MDSPEDSKSRVKKFHIRGQVPDMRIRLLEETEFHVHSMILKQHSEFFFKFLDSPDKVQSEDREWKYDWISEVEEDGDWHLVSTQNVQPSLIKNSLSDEDAEVQIRAFIFIINSMYRITHAVEAETLEKIVKLADYYLCLPIVSYHVSACIWTNSTALAREIGEEPEKFIEYAYKLRNKTLFRECAIHIAGHIKFQPPGRPMTLCYDASFPGITNPKIIKALKDMRDRILGVLIGTQMGVLSLCWNQPECLKVLSTWKATDITIPKYYRGLSQDFLFTDSIERLLRNNLVLDRGAIFEAGNQNSVGGDHFYCGTLSDEELPWDTTETDW